MTTLLPHALPLFALIRQREAEAAEERSIQEYLRRRREREAADAARQANKREAQDRWGWSVGGGSLQSRMVALMGSLQGLR